MIDLAGKRAFVTGGSRGIGRATALLLARAGAKVAVGYRTRKPAAEPHIVAAVRGDLGAADGATKAVAEALRALGGEAFDILVVNHGVWPPDTVPVAEMTDAQWESTRRANLDAVIYVCRAAIPNIADGGTIVLVS
jgi:3-oxoacyl-[acyl-carrier protein] reductase